MYQIIRHRPNEEPWNKGKIVGQKLPLKLHEIWAIRTRLEQVDFTALYTSQRGNTPVWSNPGFPTLAWTRHSMAPIRCGAQKRP